MPTFTLKTNLPDGKIPKGLANGIVDLVAQTLDKPKQYIVVHIIPDQRIHWSGSNDYCVLAELSSIGKLGRDENKKHSALLLGYLSQQLGIPQDRIYLNFVNLKKEDVGYKGTTFDDLM